MALPMRLGLENAALLWISQAVVSSRKRGLELSI